MIQFPDISAATFEFQDLSRGSPVVVWKGTLDKFRQDYPQHPLSKGQIEKLRGDPGFIYLGNRPGDVPKFRLAIVLPHYKMQSE
ncbi:MAG TPA: hypothetical protein VNM92_15775 [Thermoanaerobaculia bacterium]|nr:hypothetical protein [Thermoanaerobaculia bacterium]